MKKLTNLCIGMGLVLACTVGPVSAQFDPATEGIVDIGAFSLVDKV